MPTTAVPPILTTLVGRLAEAVPRRARTTFTELLLCTDPDLPALAVIRSYAKRWAVEPLFAAMKHGWGLEDAWQRSRQGLMRWVTILAAGYALSQMLAYTDPARVPDMPPVDRGAGLRCLPKPIWRISIMSVFISYSRKD